jgi:MFS family permease
MPLPHALRALRHRNFRIYYTGQAISMIGTWMQSIANTWLAYQLSESTAITGLVGFMGQIPMLLVAPFAGVLGDRFERRRILFLAQSSLIAVSATLALLAGLHLITVPLLVVLVLLTGILSAVETPTRQSFWVELIGDRGDLTNAIALNSVLMNATRLIGPALGGILIAVSGETACYILNVLLTLAVVASLLRLPRSAPPQDESRQRQSFLGGFQEGWRYAFESHPVRVLLLVVAVLSFTISPYATLMPAIVVVTYASGSELVGYFIGAVGLGALIGALHLAVRKNVRGLAKWIVIAFLIAGAGACSFAFSQSKTLSMLCLVLLGFGFITAGASINTILQSIVDDDKRSRVMSLYTASFIGAAPLGHLASGWLAEHIGAPRTFLVNGVACILAGLLFAWRLPKLRNALRHIYIRRGIIPPPGSGQ